MGPPSRPALPGNPARIVVPVGSTGCPGRLSLGSDGPRDRADVPVDSGQCQRAGGVDQLFWVIALCSEACGFNQLSRGTRAVPEFPQGRPPVPGDLGPGPWACGVNQLPRDTRAWFRAPTGSMSSPGQLTIWSLGPPCRPALPGDSGSGSMACGLDKVSRAIRDRV